MSYEYGYSTNLPNQNPGPVTRYNSPIEESYNNGEGFTPIATNNRGVLFQSNSKSPNPSATSRSGSNRPIYAANGGAAAGRSCIVLPSFGSGKKKKKKDKPINKSPNRTPKARNGGLFGRNNSSSMSVATEAESSTVDPYQTHTNHNDKQSLLKSFSKKKDGGNKDAREWYLDTMVEEGGSGDQEISHNNSHSNSNPARDQSQQQPYSQFTQPQRQNQSNNNVQSFDANNPAPSSDIIPNLLSLPKPEDRSHEARSRQKKMHAYQGEMEPEGVRGQEATIVKNSRHSRSSNSSPMYDVQRSSPQVPHLRNFTNSNASESSSQLLPIRQVVSNRQRQIQSLLNSPGGANNTVESHETPDSRSMRSASRSRTSAPKQSINSPGYEERMTVASSVIESGEFPRVPSNYNGYDEDVDYEEMISQNRAEFERENQQQYERNQILRRQHEQQLRQQQVQQQQQQQQQQQMKQRGKSLFHDGNQDTLGSIGSDDIRSTATPKSKSSRKSAPVSVDDGSFENPLDHIQGIHAMAMEHVAKGEYELALQAFKQVLKVYIEQHGEAHPLTASAHHNLGTVHTKRAGLLSEHTLHQRHCREQALQCFQAAARSARDCPTLGPNHPNVAVSLVRIGFLLLQSRQYENAVITFEEALRIRTKNYGLYHALVANLFNNLGVCHMHLQHFIEGQKELQQALDIQKELLNKGEDDSSTALLELADTLCNIGGLNLEWIRQQGPDARHALDAQSAFFEALELRRKVLGENHALTNQVRSLHDMVQSLPMPTNIDQSIDRSQNSNPKPNWSSGQYSPTRGKMSSFGAEFSPATVSDMTSSVGTGPGFGKPRNNDTSFFSPASQSMDASADMVDRSALSIPALKMPSGESFFPKSGSASQFNPSNRNAGNQQLIDRYDATEESFLLRKPMDEEQSASQAGGVVTYAQSTVSNGSESFTDNDRMATIRQAKNMLDSHQDFLNSPSQNNKGGATRTERTVDERDGNAYEDGLVPLAGNWPGPKNISRLSPDCLQSPSENLHTIQNCAVSYMARGRHTEAVALLEMIVECQKVKNGPLHAHVGAAVHNVGIAYLRSEMYYKAFQTFEEAVRVRKAALGEDHPEVAVSLVKFGISLMLLQRYEDSLWIFRDALSIRREALGDLHPSNARICNNIGCVHVELGDLEEAEQSFESALEIQRNALLQNSENGPMIFGASTTLQNLGYLYGKREMHEKAAMVLRESLSLQERIMPPDHPTVLITLESLAETCFDAQRFGHALKCYRQLFDRSQGLDPLDCIKQAQTLEMMATIYGHLNDPKSRKNKLEMALKFIRSMDGEQSFHGSKTERERRAFEKKLQGELDMVQANLLAKEIRNNLGKR